MEDDPKYKPPKRQIPKSISFLLRKFPWDLRKRIYFRFYRQWLKDNLDCMYKCDCGGIQPYIFMFYKILINHMYEDGRDIPCPHCSNNNYGLKYSFPENTWKDHWLYKEIKEL
ncbi:hypothetical protein M0R19_05690 [Candidatus Pacearchaeota archaeon]|nr:hypothetical protein [Candidatus Pacearchaeota archaeon]